SLLSSQQMLSVTSGLSLTVTWVRKGVTDTSRRHGENTLGTCLFACCRNDGSRWTTRRHRNLDHWLTFRRGMTLRRYKSRSRVASDTRNHSFLPTDGQQRAQAQARDKSERACSHSGQRSFKTAGRVEAHRRFYVG